MAGQGGPNLDCIQVGGSSFKSNGQLEARGELIAMPPSFRGGVVQSIMSSSLKSSASKRLAGISGHINGSLTSQLSTSTTSTNHSSSQNSKQGRVPDGPIQITTDFGCPFKLVGLIMMLMVT
ncbi:hypothetical protein Pst134EA_024632 [Puccinia striiformis f. sp. tritici]|uniref:hypothetical protein n=1 Tax=Puccinia striiformis f. sp. tritici TaxID=168172 RepID=UPI002007ECFB|nr:hypothetical protein Pst134EA_024632 [Puccinia striiformis f. sp. tritici]KAH9453767.1 hypothetical protein Pst134EA_024632 [Puccinia striiformis f. sp. tritici]